MRDRWNLGGWGLEVEGRVPLWPQHPVIPTGKSQRTQGSANQTQEAENEKLLATGVRCRHRDSGLRWCEMQALCYGTQKQGPQKTEINAG